jgi:hypothetical protein
MIAFLNPKSQYSNSNNIPSSKSQTQADPEAFGICLLFGIGFLPFVPFGLDSLCAFV